LSFSYEPELFPGLIYRMVKPRIVLLIFVSGKVVLTGTPRPQIQLQSQLKSENDFVIGVFSLSSGAKVRQEIYEAFENIYPILKGFKKQ